MLLNNRYFMIYIDPNFNKEDILPLIKMIVKKKNKRLFENSIASKIQDTDKLFFYLELCDIKENVDYTFSWDIFIRNT